MPRRIPTRTGTAVSNADRIGRTRSFATSASRYVDNMQATASADSEFDKRHVDQACGQTEAKEARKGGTEALAEEPRFDPEGSGTDRRYADAARSTAIPLTYYVRIGPYDTGKLDRLATNSGLTEDYLLQALTKAVRLRMTALRDTGSWVTLADMARPHLGARKGAGTAFMKSMIRMDPSQIDTLRASISDPLRVYGTPRLLSAYARAVLGVEIDRLRSEFTGTETRTSDRDRA